ncbi:palindromic element RPE1 domain-containing protein [Cardinium endosymbiont of Philonthus spinipes]|uniref:palindromic element RPE1 domain-containing protein n=1 Tax=Cardinium endosymbiont of Philonthus spinipes TaxID=3077941 RepID=UPI00313E4E3F
MQFLGEAEATTAAYSGVFEEHRPASTPKLPLEIVFRKRSTQAATPIKSYNKPLAIAAIALNLPYPVHVLCNKNESVRPLQ